MPSQSADLNSENNAKNELNRRIQAANDALYNLIEYIDLNPNEGDALFELTSSACEELGLLIADYPELLDARAGKKKFLPCMCAEETALLTTGQRIMVDLPDRVLFKRGTRRNQRRIDRYNPMPKRIMNYLMRRFLESVAPDEGNKSRYLISIDYLCPEIRALLNHPENKYKPGKWGKAFVEWVHSVYPHLLEKTENGKMDISMSPASGGFPRGILWAAAMQKINPPGGKAGSATGLSIETALRQLAKDYFKTALRQKWPRES